MIGRIVLGAVVSVLVSSAAFAQGFKELKREFRQAVAEENAMSISSLAKDIARFNDSAAIDTLTWGYDYFAQKTKKLWDERKPIQARINASPDVVEGQARWMKIAERNNGKIPGNYAGQYLEWQRKHNDFFDLQKQVGDIDRKITALAPIKAAIAQALANTGSSGAIEKLTGKLKKSQNWTTRAAVAEALGKINDPAATEVLRNHLIKGDRDAGVLVAILDALRAKGSWDRSTVEAAAAALRSTYWQVQYAAARALEASGSPHAIEPLAEALGRADGRLKHDIHGSLVKLTGVDKGYKPESWQTWFNTNRAKLLGAGGAEKLGGGKVAGGARPPNEGTQIQFYGIPVTSKNVVFVIDRSGSMAEPGAFNEEELQYIGTGGSKKANSRLKGLRPAGTRKIDIARYQLKKVLLMLPNGTRFNIIFYNHQFQIMNTKMVTLNDGERDKAFGFIDPLEPHGATNIWQALGEAQKFCATVGADGKLTRDGADTIYLLTDGLPFPPGKVVGPADIVSRFTEWNKTRKIVIHTIFVAAEEAKEFKEGNDFMKQLAESNNGMFTGPKDAIWKKDVEKKNPNVKKQMKPAPKKN